MAKRHPEIQILLPYQDVEQLLNISKEVKELRAENATLRRQLLALRCIQQECLEKIREIEKFL